jgi:hypothetical protein
MPLNRLDTEEMVYLTASWVIRGHPDRQALEAAPALAALLPEVEGAHQGLLDSHAPQLGAMRQREILRRQKDVDERHGETIHGIRHLLLGTISFTRDAQQLAALRGLKQRLLPEGLGVVKQSYRVQANQAETVAARLTESDWALLERLPIMGGRSLRHAVEHWFALARELGQLERARLMNEDELASPAAAAAARERWIKVIQAMRSVGAVLDRKSNALGVLERVSAIEQRADRRAGLPVDPGLEPMPARFEDVGVDTVQLSPADIAAAEELGRRGPRRR